MPRTPKSITIEEALALPVLVPLRTAATIFDYSRTRAYEHALNGQFPVETLKIAGKWKVRRSDILDYLGIEDPPRGDHDDS